MTADVRPARRRRGHRARRNGAACRATRSGCWPSAPDGVDHRRVPRPPRAARARRPGRGQHLGHRCRRGSTRRRADGVAVPLHVVDRARRRRLGGRAAPSGQQRPRPRRGARHGPRRCPAASGSPCSTGYPDPSRPSRLWRARTAPRPSRDRAYLPRHGRPIGYGYLHGDVPARRLPERLRRRARQRRDGQRRPAVHRASCSSRLIARGIPVAPLTLHTGVSSPELHEPPLPRAVRRPGGHRPAGEQHAAGRRPRRRGRHDRHPGAGDRRPTTTASRARRAGWTDLVLGPDRPARAVTGLITGLHAPEASHLQLLEAVAGPDLVGRGLRRAPSPSDYLWHEFGDSMLFLP